jgi:4-diphosphocytidyl-2-C-methyl-D-erythritol kinase
LQDFTIQEKGRAKVNLALHVTGVREDGYHILDSFVVFADIFDKLIIKRARKTVVTFTGEFSEALNVERNSVVDALELFRDNLKDHFSINIEKNLPIGAGLGGGSADAAAIIRFIKNYCDKSLPNPEDLSKLGADIPACIFNSSARVGGIGEIINPIDISKFDLWIVLVNPGVFISTKSVFEELITKNNEPLEPFNEFINLEELIKYLSRQRNDLQDVASNKYPEIKHVIKTLEETDKVLLSRMSGSGSTCFGVYSSQELARNAVSHIKKKNNKWWIRFSKIN